MVSERNKGWRKLDFYRKNVIEYGKHRKETNLL